MKTMIYCPLLHRTRNRLLSLGALLVSTITHPDPAQAATNTPCPVEGQIASAPAAGNGQPKEDGTSQARNCGAGPADALGVIVTDDFNTERDRQIEFICHTPFAASFAMTNGQLRIEAKFNNASEYNNTGAWCVYPTDLGRLEEGNTSVMRVDLVSAAGPDLMFHLGCYAGSGAYLACVGRDYVALLKTYGEHSFFFVERPKIALTNVTLSLALARRGEDVLVTTEIRDKGPGQAVLFQKTVVDTPASDPSLVGMVETDKRELMLSAPDPAGDWSSLGRVALGLWQNTDGNKPAVEAVIDNFAVAKRDLGTPARTAASSPF